MANEPVNSFGMCCVITIGTGKFFGNLGSNSLNAIGPPVDDAIATMSRRPVLVGGAIRRNSVDCGSVFADIGNAPPLPRTRAVLAATTFSIISRPMSLMFSEIEPEGLPIKSTQPSANARSVVSAPSCVIVLSIITGRGLVLMISCNAVSPSMFGISTSSVTTSGFNTLTCSSASRPSRATPHTSRRASVLSISLINCRINALSSTTSTLILPFGGIIILLSNKYQPIIASFYHLQTMS